MGRHLDPDESVLMCYVEIELINTVEGEIEFGDAMVVEKENLDEWEAFGYNWHGVGLDVNGDCKEQLAGIHSIEEVHTTTEMAFETG